MSASPSPYWVALRQALASRLLRNKKIPHSQTPRKRANDICTAIIWGKRGCARCVVFEANFIAALVDRGDDRRISCPKSGGLVEKDIIQIGSNAIAILLQRNTSDIDRCRRPIPGVAPCSNRTLFANELEGQRELTKP